MANQKLKRPVALSLLRFRFPMTAWASISHRVTGTVLVFGLLPVLYLLDMALESEEGFARAGNLMKHPLLAVFWAGLMASYLYHLLAGIRHLLMDMGIGEDLHTGSMGAVLVLITGVAGFVLSLVLLLW